MSRHDQASPPLIGITPGLLPIHLNGDQTKRRGALYLEERYCAAIENTGAIPVVLSPAASQSKICQLLSRLDGLVVSGGNFDIHPSHYDELPIAALGQVQPRRTQFELALIRSALDQDLPVLGICGGAQAINVALGGSLYQDIPAQLPSAGEHQLSSKKTTGGHSIRVERGTLLHRILRREALEVNTTHHQAIRRLGSGLIINAIAADGLIEGVESPRHSFVLGLQWHPEALTRARAVQQRIFSSFVSFCTQSHHDR
ncbi:MAG TPA: gamma-glutamyl-gamma-aminobutyrate hydrolase family protein [Terriglobales bacterium]|nr:gamma-glutamyl-gamma-aminobutyrate hydrolase family protein [Terriglobales bacterium]